MRLGANRCQECRLRVMRLLVSGVIGSNLLMSRSGWEGPRVCSRIKRGGTCRHWVLSLSDHEGRGSNHLLISQTGGERPRDCRRIKRDVT
ncbi:hypothetical protein TIFTF001_017714 [Ficus carica]|uniref:Uncharacterized protein n=1 Tax=Ficus carica TaxID=3494 RepID=A0AA88ALM5_FICCA|nr:hypothetical protein TIFTF001_017714 [Ficus carica]